MIFYLNQVLITTCFEKGGYGKGASHILGVKHGLKEFLEKCLAQFHVYIWSIVQHHNIYNYLDQIWCKTKISIHVSRVFNQTFCMQNPHFQPDKLNKPIFHKNLDIFFSTFPYIHVGNMLFIDNAPYKSVFNGLYSAIFLESFDNIRGEDRYLLGSILPYLEIFIRLDMVFPPLLNINPFTRNRCINPDNSRIFKILFVKCSRTYLPTFCNSAKLKLKQKIHY
jgi:hypothetical protein